MERFIKCHPLFNCRMALESLLKQIKLVDEGIQRPYTRLGKKWEDKGHSRYSIAIPLTAYSIIMGPILGWSMNQFRFLGLSQGWDITFSLFKLPYGTKDCVSSDVKAINHFEFLKKVDRTVRLPLFVVGVGYMCKGIYGVVNSIVNGDNSELGSCVSDIGTGSSLFAMASSLYIKDIEPKLLEKQPSWKKAFNWAKERLSSLVPEHVPTLKPVPVQSYATLDDYVLTQSQ